MYARSLKHLGRVSKSALPFVGFLNAATVESVLSYLPKENDYDILFKPWVELSPTDVFVDVGAYIGEWSIWASGLAKLVLALEPNRNSFSWLVRRTRKRRNVLCFNLAAWSEDERVAAWSHPAGGFTFVTEARPEGISKGDQGIPAVRIDTLVERLGVSPADLVLKIDAEGAEMEVLAGARNSLKHAKALFVEVHEPGVSAKLTEIQNLVSANGYVSVWRHEIHSGGGRLAWLVAKRDDNRHSKG